MRQPSPSPTLHNYYQGLSNEEIQARFPAVFADQPHESRGSRYLFVPTTSILNGLRAEGYVPTTVMHQRARTERPGLVSHGKHLIRFSHVNDLGIRQGERQECVVVNSHNGTSSFQFLSGLFRLICENGCVFGDLDSSLRVRHTGGENLLHSILEAVFTVSANSVHIMEEIAVWKEIMLSREEQLLLSETAMAHRFEKVKVVEAEDGSGAVIDRSLVPYQPQDFLRVPYSRPRDYPVDSNGIRSLYDTYQLLEENMVERPVRSSRLNNAGVRGKTRGLTGIDGNLKFQGALTFLTRRMAELKG